MNWQGGRLSGNAVITQVDGSTALGQYYGENIPVSALLESVEAPQVIDGKIALSGSIEALGKTPAALSASLSGSGVTTLDSGKLQGVRSEGIDLVLAAGDEEGFEINAQSVSPLVRDAFLQGEMVLQPVSMPFSIRDAQITMRNIEMAEVGGNSLKAPVLNFSYSILTRDLDAELFLPPIPDCRRLPGLQRRSGFPGAGSCLG